ncbi:MAG: bifunctional folylpolyglutamate synthase/dihydrofolate synthase [Firmicutes bacterium]|nr:bifunctional folylpolyglutamate synthase/dihydrofolate synthase [Bacillota bacterium]
MTYEQTIQYLSGLSKFGIVLGLDNMRALLDALGHPENGQKIIHIAGTNGKGSTGAFIAAGLMSAGYKAGRYVSPTVFCYEERFQINGAFTPQSELPEIIETVKTAAEKADITPTVFETETAAALLYFKNKGCDYTLLEVGMGGRLDATNAVNDTYCSVITPIALDHTAYLGDTLAKIAFEKAGIIKQNGIVFSAVQAEEAAEVLKEVSKTQNAKLTFCEKPVIHKDGSFDCKTYKNLKISLKGGYQYQNAALAAEVLKFLINDESAVRDGFSKTEWAGRFQLIKGDPVFIFDGAHNPQGAQALADGLKNYKNIVYICGIFADKDYKKMVGITAPLAKKVYTVTPPSPRGLDAQELKKEFLKYLPDVTATTLENAIDAAMQNKGGCVAVFGSLSFLGEAIKLTKEQQYGQR